MFTLFKATVSILVSFYRSKKRCLFGPGFALTATGFLNVFMSTGFFNGFFSGLSLFSSYSSSCSLSSSKSALARYLRMGITYQGF